MFLCVSAVNTFLLEERLGSLKTVPDEDTMKVVDNIIGVFRLVRSYLYSELFSLNYLHHEPFEPINLTWHLKASVASCGLLICITRRF